MSMLNMSMYQNYTNLIVKIDSACVLSKELNLPIVEGVLDSLVKNKVLSNYNLLVRIDRDTSAYHTSLYAPSHEGLERIGRSITRESVDLAKTRAEDGLADDEIATLRYETDKLVNGELIHSSFKFLLLVQSVEDVLNNVDMFARHMASRFSAVVVETELEIRFGGRRDGFNLVINRQPEYLVGTPCIGMNLHMQSRRLQDFGIRSVKDLRKINPQKLLGTFIGVFDFEKYEVGKRLLRHEERRFSNDKYRELFDERFANVRHIASELMKDEVLRGCLKSRTEKVIY